MKKTCLLLIVIFTLLTSTSFALDRCNEFIPDVRSNHMRYLGYAYPWWYGVGQLQQESNCRATVTAFDAGMGVAQFMPKTAKYVNSLMGEHLDPYNPVHAIRMQAFYMNYLHKQNKEGGLWLTYQAYNGGWGNLNKEYNRAGKYDWSEMRQNCKRGGVQFKWGYLDFCDVNYDYSVKVNKYGRTYRSSGSDGMRYW